MKRRSNAAEETVSLFPFLAVLLCTMGTLALIFAIASQNIAPDGSVASTSADASPSNDAEKTNALDAEYDAALAQTDSATLEELEAENESIAWFLEELAAVKTRTQTALEEERGRLAAAEKSLADLRSESTVAQKRLETLRAETIADADEDALALQEKIDALDAEIKRLQNETAELRQKNANAKRSYAILPYQGKKGVFRRPIYVECTERGVFLQPEGVPFLSTDFLLARYPGNPFDSGLRAAARRFVELNGEKTPDGQTVEPYPLLIIRPGGANRYYSAVAALASWGGDFGYEFVADDQEIAYPEPDPVLADAVREQTEFSRRRLTAQLAALMSTRNAATPFAGPSRFAPSSGAPSSSAGPASSDGFTANGGAPSSALQARLGSQVKLGGGFGASAPNETTASAAPQVGGGIPVGVGGPVDAAFALGSPNGSSETGFARDFGNGIVGPGGAPGAFAGINGADADASFPRYSGDFAQFLRPAPNAQLSQNAPTAADAGVASNDVNGQNAPDAALASTAQNSQNAPIAIPNVAAQTSQTLPPSTNASNAENAQTAQTSPSPQTATTPFLAQLQGTPQNSQNAQSADAPKIDPRQTLGNTTFGAGATGSSASGTLADSGSGATSTRVEATAPQKPRSDRPSVRENPNAIRLSDELRRPSQQGLERGIRVLCSADAIVFPKQPGQRAETAVSLPDAAPLADVHNDLTDAIVFCVKSWGVAGRNMYWAPFLKVEVAPDGEERFRELSEFCRTQGLTVVRDERAD